MTSRLPRTARDVWTLSPKEWVIYNAAVYAARLTGCWRYPVSASGDYETMTRRDKIYWLYKAQFPVVRAVKGSGLEHHFERQISLTPTSLTPTLPGGFVAQTTVQLSAVGDLMDHPYLTNSADSLYESVADVILALICKSSMAAASLVTRGRSSVSDFSARPVERSKRVARDERDLHSGSRPMRA